MEESKHSKAEKYDLIVIYSEEDVKSPRDKSCKETKEATPFFGKCDIFNDSYVYFLSRCREAGIKAALATSKDIVGPGLFHGFWTYNKEWVKKQGKIFSNFLYDKFTPKTIEQRKRFELLMSSGGICIFNNRKLVRIFRDKLKTYEIFREFAIPSIKIKSLSEEDIYLAKKKLDRLLKEHKYRDDFYDGYIIKDRSRASGLGIIKVNLDNGLGKKVEEQHKSDVENRRLAFYILQPFINCSKGFVFGKYSGLIDLRVILLNHKIIQTYIRVARKGEFKCNEHRGGDLIYRSIEAIPKDILVMTQKISKKLKSEIKLKNCLYGLDFIRSNNGNLYFIEGNSKPGLDWNHKKKINEIRSKELIDLVINKLKLVIEERNNQHQNC